MIRVAYFRNEALVELKYLLNNGVVFCVQQQGDNGLSIGMVVKEEETIKNLSENRTRENGMQASRNLSPKRNLTE